MVAGLQNQGFEALKLGTKWRSRWRRFEDGDVDTFITLSGDRNPIHRLGGQSELFERRVVHGLLGLSALTGLLIEHDEWWGAPVVLAGVSDWRFVKPVFVGDAVCVEVVVRELDDMEGQTWYGKVTLDARLLNGQEVIVQRGRLIALVQRRLDAGMV
jgi:acyl dehydratase